MSQDSFLLKGWKGETKGSYSASEILSLWKSEKISGIDRVCTPEGDLTLREFSDYAERACQERERLKQIAQEEERIRTEKEFRAKEEARRLHFEHSRLGKIYHLYLNGRKTGPFSGQEVQAMLRNGKIDKRTQVWTHELNEWVELKGFEEFSFTGKNSIWSKIFRQKSNSSGEEGANDIATPHLMILSLWFCACGVELAAFLFLSSAGKRFWESSFSFAFPVSETWPYLGPAILGAKFIGFILAITLLRKPGFFSKANGWLFIVGLLAWSVFYFAFPEVYTAFISLKSLD